MMAKVTKTQPVNSNKALVLYIARGKNYDAEIAGTLHMLEQLKQIGKPGIWSSR